MLVVLAPALLAVEHALRVVAALEGDLVATERGERRERRERDEAHQ
jgi:hypothetical protein